MRFLILRGIAFYIDGIFVAIFTVILFVFHHYLLRDLDAIIEEFHASKLLNYYFISYSLYFIVCEYFFSRTIGKYFFKFKVVFKSNNSINKLMNVIIRTIVRYIPLNPISFLFDKNYLLWHEKWTNTSSVKCP